MGKTTEAIRLRGKLWQRMGISHRLRKTIGGDGAIGGDEPIGRNSLPILGRIETNVLQEVFYE